MSAHASAELLALHVTEQPVPRMRNGFSVAL